MAGLGWQELVIVLVIVMIIFGAGKLPGVAKSLGQGVREFKTESEGGLAAGSSAAADSLDRAAGDLSAAAQETVDPARV